MKKRSISAPGAAAKTLLAGVSTLGLIYATPVLAQDSATADSEEAEQPENEIIVSGIRQSLATAQDQKRAADTVVDVITSSDIGALPDRSVSEALQRVPGVSVLRFAGPNDPDHFAVEGSGVVIRGLPFVRSELNGRDVFAANSSGILGFEDVSPELLGSVVVFKNSSADLIEGGAAGTIDLRTRLPFDQSGQVVSASLEAQYTDFADELTPGGSFLYSNSWDTDGGRFGLLGNISYNRLKTRGDGTGLVDFVRPLDAMGAPIQVDGQDVYIPSGGSIRTQQFDRERFSVAAAAQYESNDGRWLATAQFLRSDSSLIWGENVIETNADGAGGRGGLDRTDFEFDDDGVFTSGTITDNSQWRGPAGTAAFLPATGGLQLNLFRERLEEDVTNDFGFNLKFSPTDNLRLNFDVQYIDSKSDVVDLTVHGAFFSPIRVDGSGGGVPEVSYVIPDGEGADYFQDPSNYYWRSAMDHISENEADSLAFRADLEYDFSGDGWLKSVRAGARYSQQDSLIRESDFNWGNISEVWTGNDIQGNATNFDETQSLLLLGGNPNPALEALVSPLWGSFEFSDYQRGLNTGLGGAIPAFIGPGARNFDAFQQQVGAVSDAVGGAWTPLTQRDGVIEGTPYLPSEIGDIERDTFAAYARLDFDSDLSDTVRLTGNVGLRYVHTKRDLDTSFFANGFDFYFPPGQVALCDPAFVPDPGTNFEVPDFCSLDLDSLQAALGDGIAIQRNLRRSYDEFLPSLNLKFEFPGGHVLRAAASRTMTRPGVNQLNERIVLEDVKGPAIPDGTFDADGNPNTFTPFAGFVGNATGNGELGPQTSLNFDLSWEWYFEEAGSLTVAAFYKEIDDFIAFAPVQVAIPADEVPAEFLSNPLLNPLLRNAEINSDESANVKGFEVAYQQFYDFLPGVLSGLGAQFTYTYIDSKGVANELDPDIPSDDPPTARFAIDSGVFPRISKHNINAVALYEKGSVEARLAYNWRSSFQLTPRDVIFPFASIYQKGTGQLDASIFYDLTENIKVGVQAVNLLDDITVTEQTVNEEGLRAPRNFFRNDRRFTFIVRATL